MTAVSPNQRPARIALVSSDESVLPAVQDLLAPFFHITFLNDAAEIPALYQQAPLDAVIIDIDPVAGDAPDACEVLRALRAADQDVVLYAITRVRTRQQLLRVHAAGADEVLIAPVD